MVEALEIRLFVYGTLMQGEANHGELAGAPFWGSARTADGFELWNLGPYPGCLLYTSDAADE